MGRIDLILPDDLEKRFRQEVANRLGMKRGNLTKAGIEAIQLWIKSRVRRKEAGRENEQKKDDTKHSSK